MALAVHTDGQAKYVAQINGMGVVNIENNVASGIEYTGYVTPNGDWYVVKRTYSDPAGDPYTESIAWASVKNNSGKTTYAAAWAARATLSYSNYDAVF